MIGLFMIFLILISINVYCFIRLIGEKTRKNWIISVSFDVSSILSSLLIIGYSLSNTYLGMTLNVFNYLIVSIFAILIFLVLFFALFSFKVKDNNESLNNSSIKKNIVLPFLFVILLGGVFCIVDYSCFVLKDKSETKIDNNIKKEEISKMVDFLNNKYDINVQDSDCLYYRKKDSSSSSDYFGNVVTVDVPYIAVFNNNDEIITVFDRDGFISDDKQVKDLNEMLMNYFYQKTGLMFDFIEFSKSYDGNPFGNNIINSILQTKFNELITEDNIEQLLDYILQEPNLAINLYIKNSDIDILKENIVSNLEYLRNYSNIEVLKVYGYNGDLTINYYGLDNGSRSVQSNDIYDFGFYYLDSDMNDFAFSLSMDLDRGYSSLGELYNGWKIFKLN